jgi:Electron transfer DM13
MKFKNLLVLSIASLMMVSCTREINAGKSPIAVKTQANTAKPGNFVSAEQETQGKVSITTKNGQSFLDIDNSFKTSNLAPDLVVILHRSDNVIASTKPPSYSLNKGDYIILGPLKKFSGAQSYAIPNNINLTDYKSAGIWCRKFNATFGAAKLSNI